MVREAIEQRGDGRGVAEQLAPVIYGAVRGGVVWQLPHAEVVDDQQRHGRELDQEIFPGAAERGIGQIFPQRVGFAIEHAVPLENRRSANGLGEVALAVAGWAEEEHRRPETRRGARRVFSSALICRGTWVRFPPTCPIAPMKGTRQAQEC